MKQQLPRFKQRLAAWHAGLIRLARLFAIYREAAARGLVVVDAGRWMFYAHHPRYFGCRLPPSGTCTAEDLKELIKGRPLETF